MEKQKRLFTSESVTGGHPDKVADQISDAVLDAMLKQDKNSRVACETLVTTGLTLVSGEVTTEAYVSIQDIVRNTIKDIGYDDPSTGFNYQSCGIIVTLDHQSPDIAQGVDEGAGLDKNQGAGDQGMMFGYASNETRNYMPLAIDLAHRLTKRLSDVREKGILPWVRPDGKSQVTVEYLNGKPLRVDTVVISTQHTPEMSPRKMRKKLESGIIEEVIKPVFKGKWIDKDTQFHINPTGRFEMGGPQADTGLTGRKIIVDTYGGYGAHGGGAFSGKDPSKVDRSASYYARYIAKNLVAAKLATQAEVQLAYAIGIADPVSVMVHTNGTGVVPDEMLAKAVRDVFDARPKAIIEHFDLLRPIYRPTAANGHFGFNTKNMPWEKTDMVTALKAAVK